MLLINITVVMQIILALFSLVKFLRLKKIKDTKLYYHGKKSFQDIYRMNATYLWPNIFVIYFAAIVSDICNSPDIILTVMDWYWIISVWIVVTLMVTIMVAISLYMTTEIKHLSSHDGIGQQIATIEDKKTRNAARRFYISEVVVGFFVDITLLIQTFYIHIIVGVEFIIIAIFLYYFGMADVLQHEDYNSPEYKAKYKKMKWLDKFFITNIICFYRNEEYHDKAINVLHDNTSNIKKGIKSIFKI